MNEETKDLEKTPGRAATVAILVMMVLYMMMPLAVLASAGVGDGGEGSNGAPWENPAEIRSHQRVAKVLILSRFHRRRPRRRLLPLRPRPWPPR